MCVQSQPIDEIAMIAHPRDGSAKVFAIIDAYLDESGIHDNAKICVICGYFGSLAAMKRLGRNWRSVLDAYSFDMEKFHAKDLIKQRSARPMLLDLARAIEKSTRVYPVSYGIVVEDFFSLSLRQRRFLTGATIHPATKKLITSGCPSKPYFVPFQNIVKVVTDNTPVGERAHFSFGIDREFSEYAMALFKQIQANTDAASRSDYSTWTNRKRLGSPHFPKASETAQLQAADLLVHLTYLHMLQKMCGMPAPDGYGDILGPCLANTKSRGHHVYQNRELLQKTMGNLPAHVAGWDD